MPTSADVVATLDRIVRRIARRLAEEACDDRSEDIDVLAQVHEVDELLRSLDDRAALLEQVEWTSGIMMPATPLGALVCLH